MVIGLRSDCTTLGAEAVADESVVTAFVRRAPRVQAAVLIASGGAPIALIVICQCAMARRVVAP